MPTTAIIDATNLSQKAISKGTTSKTQARFNERVIDIKKHQDHFVVTTNLGTYESKIVVNAAGMYAPQIEQMVSPSTFSYELIKGEYILLGKKSKHIANSVIYLLPTKKGKGVLVIPKADQKVMVGPNAMLVTNPLDVGVTKQGIHEVKFAVPSLINHIDYKDEVDRFAGIRPKSLTDDFIIEENKYVENFINIAGIDSPGLSEAPVISKYVVSKLILPLLK